MLHLLQFEWKKQKNFNLFKILMIAYVVLLPGALMIGKKIPMEEGMPFNPQTMFFEFPTVWQWLGYTGNWLVFFVLGFLGVLLITNEHEYRTLRQNIITGMHRREFFLSKLYFMIAISVVFTVYYSLCALAIGTLHADDTLYFETVFKNWDYMPRYLLMCMGYMSFGLLTGVLIRRTGIALFVFLVYAMFLEPVIRWSLHLRYIKNKSMHFYPLNAFEDLCPVPIAQMTEGFVKQNNFSMLLSPGEAIAASGFYIVLFLFLAYYRLKNSDL